MGPATKQVKRETQTSNWASRTTSITETIFFYPPNKVQERMNKMQSKTQQKKQKKSKRHEK